jgi:hypothetical protein
MTSVKDCAFRPSAAIACSSSKSTAHVALASSSAESAVPEVAASGPFARFAAATTSTSSLCKF